jgi:hypothetical protein
MGAEQKHLEAVKIDPNMSDQQADALGVIGFSYMMNQKLTECRNRGKSGWHKPGSIDPSNDTLNEAMQFKMDLQKAFDENRMVDVANYAMMIYYRERM